MLLVFAFLSYLHRFSLKRENFNKVFYYFNRLNCMRVTCCLFRLANDVLSVKLVRRVPLFYVPYVCTCVCVFRVLVFVC